MATRSRIAIENQDGTIKSIYCHFDGYIAGNGDTLQKHYTDRSKVEKLIELGDISSLKENIEPTGEHNFNNRQEGVTVAYHRDRGEDFSQKEHKSVDDFFNSDFEEYGYLFTKEGYWLVSDGTEVISLRAALGEEESV